MPASEAMAARAKANTQVNEEVREVYFSGATRIPAVKCRLSRPGPAPVGRELSAVFGPCSAAKETAAPFLVSFLKREPAGSENAFFIPLTPASLTPQSATSHPL